MRRHVVVAFGCVNKHWIPVLYQATEEALQVTSHIRVRVFLNQQRRRSVAQVQGEQTIPKRVL
jgi:hypothetical protein